MRPGSCRAAASLGADLVEQEVRECESGECAGIGEQAEQTVVSSVEAALHVVQQLTTHLDGVPSCQPGELLIHLIGPVERIRVARPGPGRGQAAAEADRAQPGNRLPAGDPEGGVGVPDPGPVSRRPDDRDLIEPDQYFVDERGFHDPVPVDRHVAKRCVGLAAQQERHRPLARLGLVLGERKPPEHLVLGRGIPVNPEIALVGTVGGQRLAHVITGHARDRPVRQRVQIRVVEQRGGNRADAAGRNLVAREDRTGDGILDRRGHARKVSAAPCFRRHRDRLGPGRVEPRPLVVAEDEQLVLHDRAAESGAVDMLRPLRFRGVRPVVRPRVRVHAAVAIELEDVAADEVRPRLDDVADHGAGHVPRVRAVIVGLDADLREGVRAWLVGDQVVDRLVHVDAVNRVVVRLFAIAVHVRTAAAEIAGPRERAGVRRDDARQQQRELTAVAAVQRQAR